MLKREALPRFDIPGFGVCLKPDSSAVSKEKSEKYLEDTVAFLISELVGEAFALETNIEQEGNFSIRISKIPSPDLPTYSMTVDEGVFRWIYDALYVVLSNNNVFAGLGMSTEEFKIPTLEVPNWYSLDIAMACFEKQVLFDAARMDLHNFLYNVILSFILRHEMRHIANGHIGYLLNNKRDTFNENTNNGLSALDSQTMEMDVDSCVFAGLLDGFLANPDHKSMMPVELQDERGMLMTCLFTIQFLFYCLPSRKVSNLQDAQKNGHPNAFLRYFFCFTSGLSLLKDKYPSLTDQFAELGSTNFHTLLGNLHGMGLVDLDKIEADQQWTLSAEGMAYADSIWNNWDNWIPKLQSFCYLRLAGT
ncbi:hypothetical protein [Pedobacter nototheniae]|uniref:hypothetical protein n=1 Tax=Pedobacter nototheniae TaxID=2488994 RepID=UPI00103F6C9E|nr:hypothetical protein [Pedobacter nototheniae]